MNYKVIAIKDNSGVTVGIEGLNGNAVIFIGSYFLPHGKKPLSLNDGYRHALAIITAKEPKDKALTVGVPIKVSLKNSKRTLLGKYIGREIDFVAVPPEEHGTALELAKDALRRKTTVEEELA